MEDRGDCEFSLSRAYNTHMLKQLTKWPYFGLDKQYVYVYDI